MGMNRRTLTRKRFRDWLGQFLPHEIVGLRDDECMCPAAHWLRDEWGVKRVSVAEENVSVLGWGGFSSPRWLRRFVTRVDNGGESRRGVQARTALKILDSV